METLAVKYRPRSWNDVTEQENIKIILTQQLESGSIKNAYLFTGPAGCGKTTCARIFANEISKGVGTPIEIDAASHSSVDDVRDIIQKAQMKPLIGEYNIYIIDECHSISNTGWQAFLKCLEEPPKQSIFMFATTDPQKIPKTILSRVQRYDFTKISQEGIVDRLAYILGQENLRERGSQEEALAYIAKIADGGMRDAITLLDKCLAYSTQLTLENVVTAIGAVDYEIMFKITGGIINDDIKTVIELVDTIASSGKDIKLFIKSYTAFVLDVCKYDVMRSFEYIKIPSIYTEKITWCVGSMENLKQCQRLLKMLMGLCVNIKWETNPRAILEANLYELCMGE